MLSEKFVVAMTAIAACGALALTGQPSGGAGPYTAAQAAAGRATYQANCAGCHAADLSGLNSASPLAGGLFMSSWGDRTPSDLISFLEGAMPPSKSGRPGRAGVCQRHRIHPRLQRRASPETSR